MNSLLNRSSYGNFLRSGLNEGFDQFQKNMTLSQIDTQLQAIQLGQEEADYNLNMIKKKSYEADLYKTKQAQKALTSFNNYAYFQRNLNSLSNQITQINTNVLQTNAQNLKYSGVADLFNARRQLEGAVGNVYAQYGGTDIVAGTGSALDVAKFIEKQGVEAGMNAYTNKLNQANDQLAKAVQLQLNQNYQNLSLESKLYLDSLNIKQQLQD